MWDLLVLLLVGLAAGTIAKALMPGSRSEPAGWLMTMVLGVVGAYLGGFLIRFIFGWSTANPNLLGSIAGATIGAMVIIGVSRLVTK